MQSCVSFLFIIISKHPVISSPTEKTLQTEKHHRIIIIIVIVSISITATVFRPIFLLSF